MPGHQVHSLFKSELLQIEDYHCCGSHLHTRSEEFPERYEIVLPRLGIFIRRDSSGNVTADSTTILFFNAGQPYKVAHPATGGDRSTIFAIPISILLDLMSGFDPSVMDHPERPFCKGSVRLETPLRLLQYGLLRPSESAPESLAVEETVLPFLAEILRQTAGVRDVRPSYRCEATAHEHAELVEHVKQVLAERFHENLHLVEIARLVSASPYHLCRVFKRSSGLSIHQYRQRLRLHSSLEKLVEQPQEPLSRIALDLGFASHNHFSTVFRSQLHLSPSDFRRTATKQKLKEMSKILKAGPVLSG